MKRYLIHLSYFGTRYRGFQKQNVSGDPSAEDPHTICGLLEIALKGCGATNHPVVVSSSRTDKGVHALCNTAHVDLTEDLSEKKISSLSIASDLNYYFKYNNHDIRILNVQQVANDFHSRHKAVERQYLYRIAVPKPNVRFRQRNLIPAPITELNKCCFLQSSIFDAEAVKDACDIFIGTKDFGALCSKSKGIKYKKPTIKTINIAKLEPGSPLLHSTRLSAEYDIWHFYFAGRSFLYHQVRRMVAALTFYGQKKVNLSDVQRLIEKPVEESWKPFGNMFPAEGLFLLDVQYPPEDLNFADQLVEDEVNKLEEELQSTIDNIRNFKGSVLEKIELRRNLLKIESKLLTRRSGVP